MNPELNLTLRQMLEELDSHCLQVEVAPAPEPKHLVHYVRVVVCKNAPWYRRFCAQFPSSRRDQNRKGRTAIRRRETRRALERLIAGLPAGPVYGPRLIEAARAYWRRHAAELRERLAAECPAAA